MPTSGGRFYNADDYASIQAAIDAAESAGGGEVYISSSRNLSSTLTLKNGVKLFGDGKWRTILTWTGSSGGTMVTASGIDGTGITGVQLNCANLASYGVTLMSISSSMFRDFFVYNTKINGIGLNMGCNDAAYAFTAHNMFEDFIIQSEYDCIGLKMHGQTTGNINDCWNNTFMNGFIQIIDSTSLMTNYPVVLDFCDHNSFYQVHCVNTRGLTTGVPSDHKGVYLQNTYSIYPQGNVFITCPVRAVHQTGTPAKNTFLCFPTKDSEQVPNISGAYGFTDDNFRFFGSDRIGIANTNTPASAGASGAKGDICYDANYIYVCIDANTWKRIGISTW